MRRARALLESVERAGSAEWRVRPSWRMAQGDDAYWLTMDGVGEGDVSVQLDGRLLRLGVDRREAGGRYQMASQFLLPGEVAAGARPEVREEGGRVVIRIEKPVRGRRAEEAAPPDTEPGERDER